MKRSERDMEEGLLLCIRLRGGLREVRVSEELEVEEGEEGFVGDVIVQ